MKDLTSELLIDSSPYIGELIYDISNRIVKIICVDSSDFSKAKRIVTVSGVQSYSEENIDNEFDDSCMDSIVGLIQSNKNTFSINTEKKEIFIQFTGEVKSNYAV